MRRTARYNSIKLIEKVGNKKGVIWNAEHFLSSSAEQLPLWTNAVLPD